MSEEDDEDILTPVFHTLDYVSLLIVIVASIMIGLYYSIFKKDITTEGYLFGNRKLKVFPVALSIMVSILSCITLIAHPAEVYRYGSDFWYLPFALLAADIIICYFYAPVLFNLKCVTLNEYLEKRFNRSIRTFCSIIYTVNTILLMPVIMCISSLALTQVSGINFHIITTVSGLITTFYTTIGGIRAVVWTDVLQTLFIFLGIIVLAVKGTMDVGGIRNVWIVNYENYRIVPPKYALDLTERYNIREWIIGASISGVAYRGVNQGTVQRILCVPNLEAAKRCLVIGGICSLVCSVMSNYIGLLAFAAFKDCDPLSSHKISTGDQLVPLFVTYTLRNSPGLSGIIIAAFMSATLSTVSTQLNSTAAIVLNDFYKLFINEDVSEKIASIIMKSTVVIIGVLTIFSVFIVKEMGSIVQVFFMFTTILNGPLLGIFTIGMYLPRIKSRAALIGSLCGLIFITWISIGGQIARSSGLIPLNTKPVFVHGCKGNITLANSTTTSTEQVLVLYRISSLWHTPIGCLITMLTSWILSIFIKNNDVSSMDPNLYSPFLQRNIPQQQKEINETEMSLLNCKRNE